MNETMNDMVFLKVICFFGAVYLLYRVGSFVSQVTRILAQYLKTRTKNTLLD